MLRLARCVARDAVREVRSDEKHRRGGGFWMGFMVSKVGVCILVYGDFSDSLIDGFHRSFKNMMVMCFFEMMCGPFHLASL